MVISPLSSLGGVWSAVICPASSRTRRAICSCEISMRWMSLCIASNLSDVTPPASYRTRIAAATATVYDAYAVEKNADESSHLR
jgi:hypothetical protein